MVGFLSYSTYSKGIIMDKTFLSLLGFFSFMIINCAPNDTNTNSDSEKKYTSGLKISAQYKSAGLAKASTNLANQSVNLAVAIPIMDGTLWTIGDPKNWIKASVSTAGDFSIDLDNSVSANWVIMLVDSLQTDKTQKVKGYVAFNFGNENLINMPTKNITTNKLEMGKISPDSAKPDEIKAASDSTSNKQHFDLSLDKLIIMAGNDDMIKAIKNLYVNQIDGKVNIPYVRLNWFWLLEDIINKQGDIIEQMKITPRIYIQNNLQLPLLSKTELFDTSIDLTLTSPGLVKSAFDTSVVKTLFRHSEFSFWDNCIRDGKDGQTISFASPWFIPPIPEGWWVFRKNGNELVTCDIGASYSTDENGKPKVYVPSASIAISPDSVLQSITVQWFGYQNGTYIQVSDPSIIDKVMPNGFMIGITNDYNDPGFTEDYIRNQMPSQPSKQTLSYSWTVGTPIGNQKKIYSTQISYDINGVNYNFWWDLKKHSSLGKRLAQ